MNKIQSKLIILLPIIFMIHNMEEAYSIFTSRVANHNIHIISSFQFLIAVLLFTVLGFIVTYWRALYRSQKQYETVVLGFSGMLFLNVFFPHILSSIYYKSYTPGLFSAVILILPLTGYILWSVYKSKEVSVKRLSAITITGGIVGIILVFAFLSIGYFASYLKDVVF